MWSSCDLFPVEHRGEERGALHCQVVHDHLPFPTRMDDPGTAERTNVVRDELVGALDHPGEVADAQLAASSQGKCYSQAGRVGQRLSSFGGAFEFHEPRSLVAQRFGARKVEAEQIAFVVRHTNILTGVPMSLIPWKVHPEPQSGRRRAPR